MFPCDKSQIFMKVHDVKYVKLVTKLLSTWVTGADPGKVLTATYIDSSQRIMDFLIKQPK